MDTVPSLDLLHQVLDVAVTLLIHGPQDGLWSQQSLMGRLQDIKQFKCQDITTTLVQRCQP